MATAENYLPAGAAEWMLRPLPPNAVIDPALNDQINLLADELPESLREMSELLTQVQVHRSYDAAANLASVRVWQHAFLWMSSSHLRLLMDLLAFGSSHLPPSAQARLYRRLIKHPLPEIRKHATKLIAECVVHEVALPRGPEGSWSVDGWLRGNDRGPLKRLPQGAKVQQKNGLPKLTTVSQFQQLVGISSRAQLGWLLLATDEDNGPYHRYTIPKATGGLREICAPKSQLRWVQRKILDEILNKVPTHDAAHGFVRGRSTVTNAAVHQHAQVIVKFDLSDFFPTMTFFRVLGLFTSLGYHAGNARFATSGNSRRVAPVLARLCCHTPQAANWREARLPQGAPTSPAISNLICRTLDARLQGLATRCQGRYTRYADDLTFSFTHQDVDLGRLRWWVDQICHQEGFLVNQQKFRVIRAHQRQMVTGIVVNDTLRIPRPERRRFRAILHNCRVHGIESQARGRSNFRGYLRGFAAYIHMVHPEEGIKLLQEVEELLGPESAGPQSPANRPDPAGQTDPKNAGNQPLNESEDI